MPLPPSQRSIDSVARISQWAQEVDRDMKQEHTERPNSGQRHSARLQAFAIESRPGLVDISANPRLRKRKTSQDPDTAASHVSAKRVRTMVKDEVQVVEVEKRGRGRPRKVHQSSKEPVTLPHHTHQSSSRPDLTPAPVFSMAESSLSRRKSRSPRKRNTRYLDQPRTVAAIDIPFLQSCSPAIRLLDYHAIRASVKAQTIPTQVQHLHTTLQNIPHGLIPSELKVDPSFLLYIPDAKVANQVCGRLYTIPMHKPHANQKVLLKTILISAPVQHHIHGTR